MGMSIFDGAMRSIGNPSQPGIRPGGPFTPRPDLGPGVGFGPGLPPQEMEPGSLEEVDVMGGLGIPRGNFGGGKGGFGGPEAVMTPSPTPMPVQQMGGLRGRDLSGSPNTGQLMGGMGSYAMQPPAPQNRFMPRGMVPPAGSFNPRQLNVRGRR